MSLQSNSSGAGSRDAESGSTRLPVLGPNGDAPEYIDWDAGTLVRRSARLGPEQREAVRRHLQHSLPPALLDYFSSDPEREASLAAAIRAAFEQGLVRATRQHPLPHVVTPEFVRDVYDDVVGLGPLEPLLRDPRVTSVSVLNWQTILIERGASRERHAECFRDQAHLEQVADNLAVLSGYALSLRVRPRMTHFSVRPPARIHIDLSAVDGPFIGFRRGRSQPWPLAEFVRRGSLSPEAAELLARLARAEVPLLIVGPPGSGKTTLLEALIHLLPERHLVVIEDGAFELHPEHPYLTHIVVPPRSDEEAGQTAGDLAEAAKSALRKNADQVVYGEIMDGNAGHVVANASSFRFSATTLHGHTIEAGLARFAVLAQLDNTVPRSPYVGLPSALVRADLALGFRAVVLCGRLADDRQVVREVAWLEGVDLASRNADFRLIRLMRLEEVVTPAGVEARWLVDEDFRLPGPYRVNLQAADLAAARRSAAALASGERYRQAQAAVHASDWDRAAACLLDALQAGSGAGLDGLPDDIAALLRTILERSGRWPVLAERALEVTAALAALERARRWNALAQALAALDADLPLALAVDEACPLRPLRQALARGREQVTRVQALLATAARLAGGGRVNDALELLLGAGQVEPLDGEHYRALARVAAALYERAEPALRPLQRAGLQARLDALRHLAGESVAAPRSARTNLEIVQAEAETTAAAIVRLAATPAGRAARGGDGVS
jgi:pilus assembly protein CpaF